MFVLATGLTQKGSSMQPEFNALNQGIFLPLILWQLRALMQKNNCIIEYCIQSCSFIVLSIDSFTLLTLVSPLLASFCCF